MMHTAALDRLRQFARVGAAERCDLCGHELGVDHDHLLEPATRRLVCACGACAVLFESTRTRKRVPRRVRALPDFQISDAQWDALRLPINLAFFVDSSQHGHVVAYYPSPAGATESLLSLEAWQEIRGDSPAIATMASDVEALLANRVPREPEYFLAPIDQCYRLVGLIRTRWHGLSGGTEVWGAIASFFDDLRQHA
jgi:hypothetical protein